MPVPQFPPRQPWLQYGKLSPFLDCATQIAYNRKCTDGKLRQLQDIHYTDAGCCDKEVRITILPFWLHLDALSVIRLSSVIASLFIAVFLFRLKSRSVPTVHLAWAFSGAFLLNLASFLEFASPYYWQPYNLKTLLVPFAQAIGPAIAAVSLVLFAYHFPHFQEPDRKEFRIVRALCITAQLAVLGATFYNFVVLSRGRSDFSFEQDYYMFLYAVLGSQFILTVFLLLRKAIRFSEGRQRSWWRRLISSRGADALAARSLALVLFLLAVAVGGYELMTVGVIPFHLATYFIWLVFLLFYFSFIVTYLNHTVEQTTFQVKLVGLALVFVVGILGLVSMVIGRSYAQEYANRNLIGERRTIHYQPNDYGSYTISEQELQFDDDLGEIVDIPVGASQTVTAQFSFPFYGKPYRTLHVLHGPMIYLGGKIVENGWGGYHPQPAIAPLLVNLDPTRGGGIYIKNRAQRVTITWYRLPEPGGTDPNTVQLVLLPDGAFDVTYRELNIKGGYSAIRMYVFTTANLTGRHPGTSGSPVPSNPKLIGIHPGGSDAALRRIRYNLDLPFISSEPQVIFESYERDFSEYLQSRMSVFVIVLVISSLLVLFIFPRLFRTSVIKPLQALYRGMERADGGDLEVSVTPQFNDEIGALTLYFNGMLQSIKEEEANFLTLAGNAQDGILIVPEDGRIAYANKRAVEISARGQAGLIGTPVQGLIRFKQAKAACEQFWKKAREQQETEHLEGSVLIPGRAGVPVEMTISNTYWHRMPAVVVILRDISERLRREEQDRLYQQLLIQIDKLTTLSILASAVAHEINNPNQAILHLIRVLIKAWNEVHPRFTKHISKTGEIEVAGFPLEELLDNVAAWLTDIESNSERINGIVQELRSYIRGEPKTMSSVDLSTVVRSALELMHYHIDRATDNFILQLQDTLPSIRGNPQQLQHVVINLILNACQALQNRDTPIEVSTSYEQERGSVRLKVLDRGRGIPEDIIDKIREPFFTTRQNAGGTGMGLYIVASIIQDHRGTLEFTSAAGSGTTVLVDFPAEDRK
jgi:PAS domain S-box-containing protein